MTRYTIKKIDITTLEVDAIVNAANNTLSGGGGVDGAIHRAAGIGLLDECRSIGHCATGEAVITKGYDLPAKYVIHTVGPVWHGGDDNEKEKLASCYERSLQLAKDNDIKTIAFPAISCGVYHYPIDKACEIAVHEIYKNTADDEFSEVIFACFNSDIEIELNKHLAR